MGEVDYDEICRQLQSKGMLSAHMWLVLYASGATPRQIADACDVHPNSVHGILRKYTSNLPLLTRLHISNLKVDGGNECRSPRRSFWAERLHEVMNYQADKGVLPHPKLSDPVEGRLGRWLDAQRKYAKSGRLTEVQQRMLDQLGNWRPTFRQSRDEARFRQRFEELKSFYSSTSRLPSYRSTNQDERGLGIWLHGRRTDSRRGKLREEWMLSLDVAIPEWRGSRQTP
ncbi:helicase associated domain-containing protein [Paenarthrobacter sp. NPDC056912]|uniref:helicase associated domain-containing protein n=1 Tax=Paenarthrobacter sp. NPDC056912 TaxID=3345965 RepID=UPI00366DC0C4